MNGIAPGVIDTPMWEQVDALFAKYENRPLGEKKRVVGEEVPLGRMGLPADLTGVALFLAFRRDRTTSPLIDYERRRRQLDELKRTTARRGA